MWSPAIRAAATSRSSPTNERGNRVKLSERIYERAKALWPRYLTHPFVTEMADGTLPKEKFRYYMVQDYLYLRDYVKIFAAILQKTTTSSRSAF